MTNSGTFIFSLPITDNALSKDLIHNNNGSFSFYTDNTFETKIETAPFYEKIPDISNGRNIYKYYFKYTDISQNDGFSIWNSDNFNNPNITIHDFGNVPLSKNGLNFRDYTGKILSLDYKDIPNNIPKLLPGSSLDSMFFSAINFNQNIGTWNVSYFTNFTSMFHGARSFNQDISDWNVSNASIMDNMFFNATNFNQNISKWNVSNVYSVSGMFYGATNFNQNISNWNTSNFGGVGNMFNLAKAFNQPIGNWSIKSMGQMYNAFDGCGLDITNYSNMLISWASQAQQYQKTGVTLGASGLKYNRSAITARNTLTNDYKWNINNDSFSKDIPVITGFTVPNAIFAGTTFTLNDPLSTSDGAFDFVADSNILTISGKTVSVNKIGTAVIKAIQQETDNYASGLVTAIVTVSKGNPTLGPLFIPSVKFGVSFELTAPSSNSVGEFDYETLDSNIATISGNRVTAVKPGLVYIRATQRETDNFYSASVTGPLTVEKEDAVLEFNVPNGLTYSDSIKLVASSNSLGAISFNSSNLEVASISGDNLTAVAPGTVTITVNQEDTEFYTSGTQTRELTVNRRTPNIDNFIIPEIKYGESIALTAPLSDSDGEFDFESSKLGVAIILGTTLTGVRPGNAIITARQKETKFFTAASVEQQITVKKLETVLSNFILDQKVLGVSSNPFLFDYPQTNRPNAPFVLTSSNTSIADMFSGNKILMKNCGSVTITAGQLEDDLYMAGSVSAPFKIKLLSKFIIPSAIFGDPDLPISKPLSISSAPITYTSSNQSVAIIDGNKLKIIGIGETIIEAIQEANDKFNSDSITCKFVVGRPIISESGLTDFITSSVQSKGTLINSISISDKRLSSSKFKRLTSGKQSLKLTKK
jgi:surface protein